MCQNYGGFLLLLDALASSLHISAPPSQDHRAGERKRRKKGQLPKREAIAPLHRSQVTSGTYNVLLDHMSNRTAQMPMQRPRVWIFG